MSEKIGGRIFTTPEELGVDPPTEEELARARRLLDEFQRRVDEARPEDRVTELSPKFWEDPSST